jgi:uncharacterized protein with HEPN domain
MSKRTAGLLLEDMLNSVNKIDAYTAGISYDQFLTDDKTIDAVIRNFEIIGEAANRLPNETRERYQHIDWHRIRGFRNRIVHDYMGIDYQTVWVIKETFLPALREAILRILEEDTPL